MLNALKFEQNLEENLIALHEELTNGSYQPGRSVAFLVEKPKRREIFAADFRDRVVHHLLVDHLEADWERRFIHDSYACRKPNHIESVSGWGHDLGTVIK
jgi:retron-type reverse transcriptase